MKMPRVSLDMLLIVGLTTFAAKATELHVTPAGDDSNPGTRERPLQTIQRAAEVAEAGDVCVVGQGTYRETVKLSKSGEEGRPIRFRSTPGEKVVVDGTEPIAGDWKLHKGQIWKIDVDREFEQLFVDGRMMFEACWPNIRFRDILSRRGWARTGKGSRYGKIVDPELAKTGIDWTGALATLNVAHQFYTWSRRVSSHEAGSGTLDYPKNLPAITHYADKAQPWEDDFYYLSGKLEALDAPGEWFLDANTMTLYLWTLDGDSPAKHNVSVKIRTYGFEGKGLKHVSIEGFELIGCTLRLEQCQRVTVDGCHLLFPTYARDLSDLGEPRKPTPSTYISGEHNAVRNCSLALSNTHGLLVFGPHHLVENNLIHGICWNGSLQYAAIRCRARPDRQGEEDGHTIVRRNTAFNCGNAIVAVGYMPNYLVEYNHIYDGGKVCKDVSLLYTQLPLIEPSVFRYNWVHGCHTEHIALGIRGDDQTRGLTVHHNVVWDCGWFGIIVKGDRNGVYNNTVLGSGRFDVLLRRQPEPKKPWRKQWPLLKVQNANTECFNNVGRKISSSHRRLQPLGGKHGNNYIGATPMLVDPSKLDFRPHEGSPLVDAGRTIEGITDGYKGKAPDIGAYEYGGENWKPGVDWPPEDVEKRVYGELVW
jgi:hypothetical protein